MTPPVPRSFEEMEGEDVRENYSRTPNIREPVRLVDKKMDGIVRG